MGRAKGKVSFFFVGYPTEHFASLERPEIYVVWNRLSTDGEALKLYNVWSGIITLGLSFLILLIYWDQKQRICVQVKDREKAGTNEV